MNKGRKIFRPLFSNMLIYNILSTLLSDKVSHHRFLLYRIRDTCCATCFDTLEEPSHVAAELTHNLHAFLVLEDLLRGVAVYHVPVL